MNAATQVSNRPRVDAGSPVDQIVWEELGALLEDPELLEPILARVMEEVPSYKVAMRGTPMRDWVLTQSNQPIVTGILERRSPADDEDVSEWYRWGERRAQQGLAAGEMLQCWRIYHHEIRRVARAVVAKWEGGDKLMLAVLETVAAWVDRAMIATAEGHRNAEIQIQREAQAHEAEWVRGVLLGGLVPEDLLKGTEIYGLDVTRPYHAIRTALGEQAISDVARRFRTDGRSGPRQGLVAMIDGDACGFVRALPKAAPPGVVGVSGPVPFHELQAAFGNASRAFHAGTRLGLTGVYDLAALGLRSAVVADHDVGRVLAERYLTPVRELGPVGESILDTVRCVIENNGHTDAAASDLFVHSNTVRYRLNRFEEITGCSVRDYSDLFEIWWALEYDSGAGRGDRICSAGDVG